MYTEFLGKDIAPLDSVVQSVTREHTAHSIDAIKDVLPRSDVAMNLPIATLLQLDTQNLIAPAIAQTRGVILGSPAQSVK